MLCGLQTNFLQNNAYQLVLPRFPLVQYYSTDFVLPELILPASSVGSPFTAIRVPGDTVTFGEMRFTFMIDENMNNYNEILTWLTSIGFSESYTDFTNYPNKDKSQPLGEQDVKVIVLSNKGNPIRTLTFKDAFPTSLSGVSFTSQDPDTNYVKATITMAYTTFKFE